MPVPQIKQETFFLVAWILMAASVIGSVINSIMSWAMYNIGGKIVAVSGILFNVLLFLLFLSMWVGQTKTSIKDDPELEKYLKSLSEK